MITTDKTIEDVRFMLEIAGYPKRDIPEAQMEICQRISADRMPNKVYTRRLAVFDFIANWALGPGRPTPRFLETPAELRRFLMNLADEIYSLDEE